LLGSFDFLSVAGTNCGDGISKDDATLEKVDFPVELQIVEVKKAPV